MVQTSPNTTNQTETATSVDEQVEQLRRAGLSIQHILKQVETFPIPLQTELQNELGTLSTLSLKLSQRVLQIATFGFVSRGKSAVLNVLFSEPIFPVGPLNGETQWPRSVRWSPEGQASQEAALQIELIDTPGLDEIEGQGRAQMAQGIARTADLLLFVVAGPPTGLELAALKALRQAGRPLLLVVNKADLYPELDADQIYGRLDDPALQDILSPEDILLISAAPAPIEVRVEWPDGRITTDWEAPPTDIESLRSALLQLIHQEGLTLLTLNTLLQIQTVERDIADHVKEYEAKSSQSCMGQYARLKAVLIALCPFAVVDMGIGILADLLLIGSLVKLYRLPTHRYQVNQLWGQLLLSTVSLMLVEAGGPILFDLPFMGPVSTRFLPWLSLGFLQACVSLYGATQVGKQTQAYLINGYTWGPLGPSTMIKEMLNQLQPQALLYRLRQEWFEQLR
ncbi:GTP-binding protein [Acaryochloris sp. IP29b_bin.148]|uniref:GTP-binding protein n=1 Tax=Acaryochloris sp. IP29b_bin.148 TaxID=2969218 RepID=UPI00263331A0|nr:GTP-binding protein [Acaryochloris sp. IP29b_bin.148]